MSSSLKQFQTIEQIQKILQGQSFHPIVKIQGTPLVRDYTKGIDEQPLQNGQFDIGKYNEKRGNMYETEYYQDSNYNIEGFSGKRDIHMGIDIGGPVDTPIHAFADGSILHFGYNSAHGDYGHVIITKHEISSTDQDNYQLFALYGHLSAQSLIGLQHNKTFKKGEVIGYFGKESENGGWSPHVHFQLAIEEPITHDLPGVVSNQDHERAMLQFPDPRLVLGDLYTGQGSGPLGMWVFGDHQEF